MHRLATCFVRAAAAALFSFAAAAAQQPAATATPTATPKQALAEARAAAAQAKGKQGPERAAALEAGAKAFQQVAAAFQAELGVVAEASFEAAELWRRKGALAEAEAAYRVALDNDPSRYEARASLELAHLLRRGKKFEPAVELYRKVATLQPGSARAQSALVWIGRTWQSASKLDEAIAAFDTALQSAPTAAAVIDAGDWLAKVKLKKGDRDGAKATLVEVEKRTANDTAGDTPAAKRLQTALADMSARRALQRASDKKTKAADDAVDVEEADESEEESEEKEETGNGKKEEVKKRGR